MARETRFRLLLLSIAVGGAFALSLGSRGAAHAVPFAPGPLRVVFEDDAPRPSTRRLEIRTRDRFGDPVPDAAVRIVAPRARGIEDDFGLSPRAWAEPDGELLADGLSDAAGLLRVAGLPSRTLEVVAEHTGRRGLALVPAGTAAVVDLGLRPTRRVEVVVRDERGRPVEDVPVDIAPAFGPSPVEASCLDDGRRYSAHAGARRLTDGDGRADFVLVRTLEGDDDAGFGLAITAVVPGVLPVTRYRSWREIAAGPTRLVVPETGRTVIELVEAGTGSRTEEIDVVWCWDTGAGPDDHAAGDLRIHGGRLPLRLPWREGSLHTELHDRGLALGRSNRPIRPGTWPVRIEVPPERRVRLRVVTPEGRPSREEVTLAWPGRAAPDRGVRTDRRVGSAAAIPDEDGCCEFRIRAAGPLPLGFRYRSSGPPLASDDRIVLPVVPPGAVIDLGTFVRPEPRSDAVPRTRPPLGELRFRLAPEDSRELGAWELSLLGDAGSVREIPLGVDGRPQYRTQAAAGRYRLRWRWRHDPRGRLVPPETRELSIEPGRITDLGDIVPAPRLRPVEVRLRGPNGGEVWGTDFEFSCEAAGLRFPAFHRDAEGQIVFLPRAGAWRVAAEGFADGRAEAPVIGASVALRLPGWRRLKLVFDRPLPTPSVGTHWTLIASHGHPSLREVRIELEAGAREARLAFGGPAGTLMIAPAALRDVEPRVLAEIPAATRRQPLPDEVEPLAISLEPLERRGDAPGPR